MAVECTKENPWDHKTVPVRHHGAHEVPGSQRDGWPSGDTVQMKCDYCGHEWEKELPQ